MVWVLLGQVWPADLYYKEPSVTILDSMIPEYGGNLHNLGEIEDQVKIDFADVRESEAMQRVIPEQDFLFNLAGQTSHLDSMENPFTDLDINAKAQLSILESCRTHNPGIRIVFASTAPKSMADHSTYPSTRSIHGTRST